MTIETDWLKVFNTEVLLLTGAGASKPLGMPLMRDFYDLVITRIDKAQSQLLHDIDIAHMNETGEVTLDLEALLALIERYRGFYNILFNDEIFGKTVDDEWKEWAKWDVEGLLVTDSAPKPDYLAQAYFKREHLNSLDTLLRDLMFEMYGKELDDSKLEELYSPLLKVIGRYFPQEFIPIFTTNYDVAIEAYAKQANIQLETGFESTYTGNIWKPSRFYQFKPDANIKSIALFKLHGSLTWHKKGNIISSTNLPIRNPRGYESVVVYPTQTKSYPDEEPFRTMYDFLRGYLRQAKLAIVIGYSFRDTGIHQIMVDAIELNPNLFFILICGPNVDSVKQFAKQNLRSYQIIPHYFDSAPSGGEYIEELDAALNQFLNPRS